MAGTSTKLQNEKSNREKMLAGELYIALGDPELQRLHASAVDILQKYNQTKAAEKELRKDLLLELLGSVGSNPYVEPSFFCDYGCHITVGSNFYANTGCVILDCNRVSIGDNVLVGPNVHIYTAHHPIDPVVRLTGQELATPVTIGNNVWIGGCVVICPGVSIGENTTIGAGSIVTKNVPANVVAAGNPCRVLRSVANTA